jgi:energy-converting hydrogenase A subunit M
MGHGNQDTFETVRKIVARNLEIDVEAIDAQFQFHNFIDVLANLRRKQSGCEDLLDYIEAANIYVDLSETFQLHFFTDFTDCTCITIADLVNIIQAKLDSLV